MIIESIQIKGFGCLQGNYDFSTGLNLIIAPNESGKTTIAAALTVLLFGIKGSSRRSEDIAFKRYSPLTGGEFSISGVVKLENGRKLNIWRDFSKDTFRVVELLSGKDVTLDYAAPPNGDCLGQTLTGLSFLQYRKLAFLNQDELNKNWEFVEFADQLSALFSTDNIKGNTVEQAKNVLADSLSSFSGITSKGKVKVDTEINRINKRLHDISKEIEEIEAVYAKVEEEFALAADKRLAGKKIQNRIKECEYCIILLRLNELQENLAESLISQEKLRAVKYEISQLKDLKDCDYADIEQMAELLGLLSDKKKRLAEYDKEIADSQDELEYLRVRVDNLGQRVNVTEEILQNIEKNIDILESYQGREKSVLIDCRSAEAVLSEAGVESSEVKRFNEWAAGKKKAEVALVKNYLQIKDKLRLAENELKQQKKNNEVIFESISQDRFYHFKSARNNLFLGCIFTAVSVGTFFAMGMLFFMLAPALVCICWALWGAVKLGRTDKYRFEEEQKARVTFERLNDDFSKFVERDKAVAEKFSVSASEMGYDADSLFALLVRFKKAETEIDNWEYVYDRHRNISDVLEESILTLKDIFCEIGVATKDTYLDVRRAKVMLREVSDALSLIVKREKLEEKIFEIELVKEKLNAEVVDLEIELKDHFNAAGIVLEKSDYSEAMDEFREKVAARRRLQQLEDVELNKVTLEIAEGVGVERLEEEISVWEKRRESFLYEDRWLENKIPQKEIYEYENDLKVARLQLEDTQGELVECEKVLALEESRRKDRLPELENMQNELLVAKKKAETFNQAVKIAIDNLDSISIDLHARWSPLFSEEYNEQVSSFSGGLEFKLSKELKLNATIKESGYPLDNDKLGMYMSRGMRDQAYLVLRLLLAQKVVESEVFPLVLDDPFVNADDERFRLGMKYLLDISRSLQVFVFSCHGLRHDDLCFDNDAFADALIKL